MARLIPLLLIASSLTCMIQEFVSVFGLALTEFDVWYWNLFDVRSILCEQICKLQILEAYSTIQKDWKGKNVYEGG